MFCLDECQKRRHEFSFDKSQKSKHVWFTQESKRKTCFVDKIIKKGRYGLC